MSRSSFDASFRLFEWAGLFRDDADVDGLEFRDPYPNPEETLLAMEAVACRGFWAFGTPREKIRTTPSDRYAHKKRPPSEEPDDPEEPPGA
jgi:hypothetical protein